MNFRKWYEMFSTDVALKYNSVATQENYKSCIRLFLLHFEKYAEPKEVPTSEIKQWLLECKTLNTRRHRLCAIKAFYKLTVGMPTKIDRIPFPKHQQKLPIVLDSEDIQKMLGVCQNIKHKTILCLLYATGLRISELINLELSCIDRSRMVIHILNAKGGKDRQVPLHESLLRLIEQYYRQHKPSTYLFEGQTGGKYSERSVAQVLVQLGTKANIKKRIYPHLIRHSCFTAMLEQGVDTNIIQKLAGHSSPKTTQIYTHISTALINKVSSPMQLITI